MKELSEKNFGLVIAFLLPGFVCLLGLACSSPDLAEWLAVAPRPETAPTAGASTATRSPSTVAPRPERAPTVGGFLYVTVASLATGLILSAVRWLIVDHMHHCTGVRQPTLKFENLTNKDTYAAFLGTVEAHYRFYQYYANTLVAIVIAFSVYWFTIGWPDKRFSWLLLFVALALYFGSRDALRKYYDRARAILNT